VREYEEDGWIVSTPIFMATSNEDMEKMTSCKKHDWSDGEPTVVKDKELTLQTCLLCGANRTKRRP
tara:strand:- start:29 stop:226 length:198 start_codon:yes stop_codon:yes gene_type:complete